MDRILIILRKENGPRASSVPALWLNTMIFQHVYWYMQQISGERLQDHWSSCFTVICFVLQVNIMKIKKPEVLSETLHKYVEDSKYRELAIDLVRIFFIF